MKYVKKLFVFLIISTLFLPVISIATTPSFGTNTPIGSENTESTTKILSVSSESVSLDTDFYLILNLGNIAYNKFKVEIRNTANLAASTVTSTISNLKSNTNITTFVVDKSLINLEKLGIVYTSPAQETNIEFTVIITDLETTEDTLKTELASLKTEIEGLQTKLSGLKDDLQNLNKESETYEEDFQAKEKEIEELEKTIEEKITETDTLADKITNFVPQTLEEKISIAVRKEVMSDNKNEFESENSNSTDKNQDKPWDDKDSLLEQMDKDKTKEMTSSMRKMMDEMSQLENNLKTANDTISSLTKTVTYQGSQNNYLSSLSIKNVEFKNTFKKTTLNYFATVDENTTSVTINATPEDSSAIVTIYGNTNLKSGKNKVLITVTADDGSIRTYKIYITK